MYITAKYVLPMASTHSTSACSSSTLETSVGDWVDVVKVVLTLGLDETSLETSEVFGAHKFTGCLENIKKKLYYLTRFE